MSEKQSNAIGDVVRAFAASDYRCGYALAIRDVLAYLPPAPNSLRCHLKSVALRELTRSLIQFDRSITGDHRGVTRTLPEIQQ